MALEQRIRGGVPRIARDEDDPNRWVELSERVEDVRSAHAGHGAVEEDAGDLVCPAAIQIDGVGPVGGLQDVEARPRKQGRREFARALVVVAGMEGALPSVVGGLVSSPVIAVPTSVGYGASFGGIAALLGMLNSCAAGVTVVNIDNGFGAAYVATLINRL